MMTTAISCLRPKFRRRWHPSKIVRTAEQTSEQRLRRRESDEKILQSLNSPSFTFSFLLKRIIVIAPSKESLLGYCKVIV